MASFLHFEYCFNQAFHFSSAQIVGERRSFSLSVGCAWDVTRLKMMSSDGRDAG